MTAHPALSTGNRPRLLVSVRNAVEAAAALAGGADIVDVKEPAAGPLGMASAEALAEILDWRAASAPGLVLSAALGELAEWTPQSAVPPVEFVKLGPAGLATPSLWRDAWCRARRSPGAEETGWVAVVYADWETAGAPLPAALVDAALAESCDGVLFDTFDKHGPRLFDSLAAAELSGLAERIHAAGRWLALAGRLREDDVPPARACGADVLAVRGAACRSADRIEAIDTARVRRLKQRLQDSST